MDDLMENENKVDNFEGQPISPVEMGIKETSIGGGETVKPSGLSSELREIFNPAFSTLGHGTRVDAAKEILQQGLKAKVPDLDTTAIPLFDSSKPYEDQIPQTIEQISHWPHLDAKAVVVVMIPNPQEGEQGGRRYFNSVFQELPEPDTGYNARYLIPPGYIRGYVDVETNKFIPNPKFKPEKPVVKDNQKMPRIIPKLVDIPSVTNSSKGVSDVW